MRHLSSCWGKAPDISLATDTHTHIPTHTERMRLQCGNYLLTYLLEHKVSSRGREGFLTIKATLTTCRQSFHNSYAQEVGWIEASREAALIRLDYEAHAGLTHAWHKTQVCLIYHQSEVLKPDSCGSIAPVMDVHCSDCYVMISPTITTHWCNFPWVVENLAAQTTLTLQMHRDESMSTPRSEGPVLVWGTRIRVSWVRVRML